MNPSFHFKELGVIRQADLTLGDFTIVCGRNNSGKTYAAYAIYGFLDYWHNSDRVSAGLSRELIAQVLKKSTVTVPVSDITKNFKSILKRSSRDYSRIVNDVFAGNRRLFHNTEVEVTAAGGIGGNTNMVVKDTRIGSARHVILEVKAVRTKNGRKEIEILLLVNEEDRASLPDSLVARMLDAAIRESVLKNQFPKPFIASAERTGSAIFQKELDFTRNRLVELIGQEKLDGIPMTLWGRFKADYPIPVRKNVDFIRGIPSITNRESVFADKHPHVLSLFKDIIGGEYKVAKSNEILYVPSGKSGVPLTMAESSSAVRSLLDIGFYLKHIARPGDILVIDEPELNLHPDNQRRVARLLAALVNCGIKVFMTTHSDYIIKELSMLTMLNAKDPRMKAIAKEEGYDSNLLLSHRKMKVYAAEEKLFLLEGNKKRTRNHTLAEVEVNEEEGIVLHSFDNAIDDMNRIHDEIIWGD